MLEAEVLVVLHRRRRKVLCYYILVEQKREEKVRGRKEKEREREGGKKFGRMIKVILCKNMKQRYEVILTLALTMSLALNLPSTNHVPSPNPP